MKMKIIRLLIKQVPREHTRTSRSNTIIALMFPNNFVSFGRKMLNSTYQTFMTCHTLVGAHIAITTRSMIYYGILKRSEEERRKKNRRNHYDIFNLSIMFILY